MAGPLKTTPSSQPPSLKKSSSSQSSKNQKTIMGFFNKKPSDTPPRNPNELPTVNGSATRGHSNSLTPAPSSDPPEEPGSAQKATIRQVNGTSQANGLPSPITPANASGIEANTNGSLHFNSPSRKVSQFLISSL